MTATEGTTVADVQQNMSSFASSGPKRVEYKEHAERKRLTKADIVNGTKQTRDHYVKQWDGYVAIRPLSEGEWQKIRQLSVRGVREIITKDPETGKNQRQTEIDYEVQNESAAEADRIAVAAGLSVDGEEWTVDEVAGLRPATVVEEIAQEVYRLSGIKISQPKRSADDSDASGAGESEASLDDEVEAFPSDS